MSRGVKLQFKFHERADAGARKKVLRALGKAGAARVRRLFPRERDDELGTLYIVDCKGQPTARRLVQFLNRSKAVQFAEEEVRRKLIR